MAQHPTLNRCKSAANLGNAAQVSHAEEDVEMTAHCQTPMATSMSRLQLYGATQRPRYARPSQKAVDECHRLMSAIACCRSVPSLDEWCPVSDTSGIGGDGKIAVETDTASQPLPRPQLQGEPQLGRRSEEDRSNMTWIERRTVWAVQQSATVAAEGNLQHDFHRGCVSPVEFSDTHVSAKDVSDTLFDTESHSACSMPCAIQTASKGLLQPATGSHADSKISASKAVYTTPGLHLVPSPCRTRHAISMLPSPCRNLDVSISMIESVETSSLSQEADVTEGFVPRSPSFTDCDTFSPTAELMECLAPRSTLSTTGNAASKGLLHMDPVALWPARVKYPVERRECQPVDIAPSHASHLMQACNGKPCKPSLPEEMVQGHSSVSTPSTTTHAVSKGIPECPSDPIGSSLCRDAAESAPDTAWPEDADIMLLPDEVVHEHFVGSMPSTSLAASKGRALSLSEVSTARVAGGPKPSGTLRDNVGRAKSRIHVLESEIQQTMKGRVVNLRDKIQQAADMVQQLRRDPKWQYPGSLPEISSGLPFEPYDESSRLFDPVECLCDSDPVCTWRSFACGQMGSKCDDSKSFVRPVHVHTASDHPETTSDSGHPTCKNEAESDSGSLSRPRTRSTSGDAKTEFEEDPKWLSRPKVSLISWDAKTDAKEVPLSRSSTMLAPPSRTSTSMAPPSRSSTTMSDKELPTSRWADLGG